MIKKFYLIKCNSEYNYIESEEEVAIEELKEEILRNLKRLKKTPYFNSLKDMTLSKAQKGQRKGEVILMNLKEGDVENLE